MLPSEEELNIVKQFIQNELLTIEDEIIRRKTIEKMMINYVLFRLSRYQMISIIQELESFVESNQEIRIIENMNLEQSNILIKELKKIILLQNFNERAMHNYNSTKKIDNYDEFISMYLNLYDFGDKLNEIKEVIVEKFLYFILCKIHPKIKENEYFMNIYSTQEIITKFHYDELTNYKIIDRFVTYGICKIPNVEKTDTIAYYEKLDDFMNQYISKKYEHIHTMNDMLNSDFYINFYDTDTEKNENKMKEQIQFFMPTSGEFFCTDEESNKKIFNFIRYASTEL
jgi:hypothetical protein